MADVTVKIDAKLETQGEQINKVWETAEQRINEEIIKTVDYINNSEEILTAKFKTETDARLGLKRRVEVLESQHQATVERYNGMLKVLLADMVEVKAKSGTSWQ